MARFVDIRKAAAKMTAKMDDNGPKIKDAFADQYKGAFKPEYSGSKGTTSPITQTLKGPIIGPVYISSSTGNPKRGNN